jgi:hypothetical protein
LKLWKKLPPADMILLVSKLPSGKLVKAPFSLKRQKKLVPTDVALSPNRDNSGIALIYISLAVVQAFDTSGS